MKEAKLIKKKVTRFGNSCHILIPKKYEGKMAYAIVFENSRLIKVHKNDKKKIGKQVYYRGELTDSAGTHSGFWVRETDAKDLGLL